MSINKQRVAAGMLRLSEMLSIGGFMFAAMTIMVWGLYNLAPVFAGQYGEQTALRDLWNYGRIVGPALIAMTAGFFMWRHWRPLVREDEAA